MQRQTFILRIALSILAFLLLESFLFCQAAPPQSERALLLISIDGMRPDYVLNADQHGLKIPTLRRILRDGAHASGVVGVLPTVTYPSHTTILTGVWPAQHGIYSNVVFDPLDRNMAGWYWYAEDIKTPTLWDAASKAGLRVGSVSWPVSVGDKSVDYLIPEFWRAQKSADDLKLLRAVSTPNLIAEIEKEAGPYVVDLDAAEVGDRQRTKYAVAILREKKPQFMTVHLASLDHLEHSFGPFSPEANATLEQVDGEVQDLEEAARFSYPKVTICVVSDHGFTRTDHSLNLPAAFVSAGLITLDAAHKVVDWKAMPQLDGGSAAILVKNPQDQATKSRVEQLLRHMAADPSYGIAGILGPKEIATYGGRPGAILWVDMKSNFVLTAKDGPLVSASKVGGAHGYSPSNPEVQAAFFIAGPGIEKGLDLGQIDMRAIAPTLADVLGVSFTSGDVKALQIRARE